MAFVGFDTSNYTTSVAAYFPEENRIIQFKRLLPVKSGEKGLRQSDAVFHHTAALSKLCQKLYEAENFQTQAVCASASPRLAEGSYMPCFLVGKNAAECVASALKVPYYETSHQHGHILAALFSAGQLDLVKERFIAFHVSGGTTEALMVTPDEENIFSCKIVANSLDLKAGQAVDRVGLMLGLDFPCGPKLDELAQKSKQKFKIKPSIIDGNCSLSGVENKCRNMISEGYSKEDTARFCIEYISASLEKMTDILLEKYGNLPLLYAGGVMSNSIIREKFTEKYNAFFADAQFSSDNAAGTAIMCYLKSQSAAKTQQKKNEER
ncbi:MAG: peptidase M22 [Acutalibacteraceae bacterium]